MDYATYKSFENAAKNASENRRQEKRQKHSEELKTFDARQLEKMPPEKLAVWQSEFEEDEPQWVLADQEWKRRGGISTRRIAIVAIIISGLSLLIAALAFFHSLNGDGSSPLPQKSAALSYKPQQPPAQLQQSDQVSISYKADMSTNLDSVPILPAKPH